MVVVAANDGDGSDDGEDGRDFGDYGNICIVFLPVIAKSV